MRTVLRVVVVTCAAACSPSAPPASTIVVPSASAPTPPPAMPAEAPPAPPPAREVREPVEVACRIGAMGWKSDQLRVRADALRFARADRVRTTLVLPVTEQPTEAVAVMDDGRVLLRAVLALADVHLYAAKATALSGIVTPAATTDLAWKGSMADHVRIELDTASVLRAPRPFRADLACADLAIVAATYDARATITKKTGLPKRDVKSGGAAIAAGPTTPPVGELEGDVQVEIVETRGAVARILVDEHAFVVSGWVAQKDLAPANLAGIGVGFGSGGERMDLINQLHLMHCPSDVSLFVEAEGERTKVGLVHKEAGFRLIDDKVPFRAIDLPESQWLRLEKNARFVVDATELAACKQDSPGF